MPQDRVDLARLPYQTSFVDATDLIEKDARRISFELQLRTTPNLLPLAGDGRNETPGSAAFMSSGYATKAGRVFLISVPMAGSRLTL